MNFTRWIPAALLLISMSALANPEKPGENLGRLKVSDVLLRPEFTLKEPQKGAFSLGDSSLAVEWDLRDEFSGVIRVGPRSLLNPLAHFTDTVNSDIVLVEAYAQYTHPYLGRIRLGRQPILFGMEGQKTEGELIFPRPLLYQMRAMGLRDVGISYEIDNNNYYTSVMVHNGEGDTDKDGRMWYTGRWGYRANRFELGASGQTGTTTPESTASSNDTLAGVDPSKSAKWRIYGFHVVWTPPRLITELESYMGEMEQDKATRKFYTGHFDIGYEFSKKFSSHLRVDVFDPDNKVDDDAVYQGSVALVWTNESRNSRLILVGTKTHEEGHHQTANDEARLIWSLSPTQVFSNF